MGTSNISWLVGPDGKPGKVWNPVTGCSKISEGCKHCYAEAIAKRFWKGRKFTDVQCHEDRLDQPLHWKKPQRIFVNSMSDLFHPDVPKSFIDRILEVMEACPQHTFMVLTKRPELMEDKLYRWDSDASPVRWLGGGDVLPNLWLGVSAENQEQADKRIPILLETPAAIRWVSVEPMLGPVYLRPYPDFSDGGYGRAWLGKAGNAADSPCIDWVVCGGESGPGYRPMEYPWAVSLQKQCEVAGIPFYGKQIAGPKPGSPLLFDGKEIKEFPNV